MSMCSLLLCCWKRVFAVTSAFSWQNSVSLWPASFCTPKPNLPVTPGIIWLPTFAFQSPVMKRTSFWGVSSRRSYKSSKNHSTSASSALVVGASVQFSSVLGLLWYWMVCLGDEQRSFCRFWDCIQVLHFRLFCWLWRLFYSKGFLPTVVDIMIIWVKFSHSSPL